jgi:hypothetical protein
VASALLAAALAFTGYELKILLKNTVSGISNLSLIWSDAGGWVAGRTGCMGINFGPESGTNYQLYFR